MVIDGGAVNSISNVRWVLKFWKLGIVLIEFVYLEFNPHGAYFISMEDHGIFLSSLELLGIVVKAEA